MLMTSTQRAHLSIGADNFDMKTSRVDAINMTTGKVDIAGSGRRDRPISRSRRRNLRTCR